MKAAEITPGQELPGRLDRHPAIRERHRSAVSRATGAERPQCRDAEEIARQYRAGYSDTSALDDELEGWGSEGTWPEE